MSFFERLMHPRQRPPVQVSLTQQADRPSVPPTDPQDVVAAAGGYSRSMLRAVGAASGIAFAAFIAQAVFAAETQFSGEAASRTVIPYPGLGLSEAGSALLVLLPVSIALQILVRLPRDPEQLEPEDAVAQRQFWGSIARLVAAGAAFVAIGAFAVSFVTAGTGSTLDLNQIIGAPLGSVMALILAADAAATAQRENERLELARAYRDEELSAIAAAIRRVHGDPHPRPRRRLIVWTSTTLVLSVAVASVLTWLILSDGRATALYGVIALIITLFGVVVLPRAVVAVLRGKPLDLILHILPPALVILVFSLQLIGFTFPLISRADMNEPWAYVPGIAYGLLLFLPVTLVTILLSIGSPWTGIAAPLPDYSRSSLEDAANRLRDKEADRSERETWEVFAWTAIGASLLPFVSLFLAVAATFHRARPAESRAGLFRTMWICVAAFTVIEVAALLLFPVYAVALGWTATQ